MRKTRGITKCRGKSAWAVVWVGNAVEKWSGAKVNDDKEIADYFGVSPESFLAGTDDPAIKKALGINAEGFVPTMRDWEEQAESWTDDQILQAMQKLVEIQQRRRSDGH